MRSTSSPRAATSVATRMSSLPFFSCSIVRSRCACVMSPLSAALRSPRASSFSASSSVACLVRAKTSIASNVFDLEDARQRIELVEAADLDHSAGGCDRRRLRLDPDLDGLAQVVCDDPADRDPASSPRTARSASPRGVCFRMSSTSSMKPMRSISSASSRTTVVSRAELQRLAPQVIEDPARRADDDVHAAPQTAELGPCSGRRRSAARGSRAGAARSVWNASATWIASSRVGASTSGCGLRLADRAGEERQRERRRLAGAGLRLAEQVAAFEQRRDRGAWIGDGDS